MRAEAGASLAHQGDVGFAILAHRVPAELDGREPLVGEPPRPLAGLGRGRAEERAGIGPQRLAEAPPEQLPDRQAERLPLDVPEGQVDAAHRVHADPAPAAIDIGPVHLVPEILGLERVFADHHVRQPRRRRVRERALDAPLDRHRVRVDLAIAGDPGIGADLDDQGVLTAVALGLHIGQAEVDRFDGGDFQVGHCLDVAPRIHERSS